MKKTSVRRPALRYHGGKWVIAPWIISQFPPHRVYVEPYGGAASVLLRKSRSFAEVYNDIDSDVVNLFRVLRDPESARRLVELLRLTPFAREELKLARESAPDPIERARRLVTRSFLGFGSSSHNANRKTGFRKRPFRTHSTGCSDFMSYPNFVDDIVDRFQGIVIECRNAIDVIRDYDGPDTLLYIDPPYMAETRKMRREYLHETTDADHNELLSTLRESKSMIVLSGYRTDTYDVALRGWQTIEHDMITFRGARRVEVLWINPRALEIRQDLFSAPAIA
jgi:DNA adenine methylase